MPLLTLPKSIWDEIIMSLQLCMDIPYTIFFAMTDNAQAVNTIVIMMLREWMKEAPTEHSVHVHVSAHTIIIIILGTDCLQLGY